MVTQRPRDGSAAFGRISTIHDVARVAGVSKATVSRALRGLPRVSPDTRARVLRTAAELNYVASPNAASLASGKTGVVAVVVPFMTRWYFAELLSGAETVLRDHGYHVLLFDLGVDGSTRGLILHEQLLLKRVDGVLVLSLDLMDSEWRMLSALRVPVVTVGVRTQHWPCVRIDDVETARIAVRHLIGLGHRSIGHVGGDHAHAAHFSTPIDRRAGYEEVLAAAGLRHDPRHVTDCDWTARGGVAAAQPLFRGPERPTAIFAASDEIAMGVLHAARQHGLRVPDDLSVVGIDDHDLSFTHDLTTVAQQVPEQGHAAGEILLDALRRGGHPGPEQGLTSPTALVVRNSTGPVLNVP